MASFLEKTVSKLQNLKEVTLLILSFANFAPSSLNQNL
ncbi:hypothetical protein NU08_4241 [Flavobacterium anhuiense]|uniref:Uncharacterized protein n=1 Tax=Flavobacterium anhuiense TaxID=459526 RepID=A0A444VSU9_9FLAO|nr:hypothetical protein NU08_4241 [Flavobacterium anhuiense]